MTTVVVDPIDFEGVFLVATLELVVLVLTFEVIVIYLNVLACGGHDCTSKVS